MQIASFTLQTLIAGRPAREYGHDGRTYIVGRHGADYTVRLTNKSGRRVKAVLAVDGLSVIDGKPAGRDGPGYVIDPYSTLDVPGWRLTDDSVARFVFGAPAASLAAHSGSAENVGVLAAAFFEEVPPPYVVTAMNATRSSEPIRKAVGPTLTRGASARGTLLEAGGGSLGTGFGTKVEHAVRKVEFDAKAAPAAVIEIRYEDAAMLRGLGLDVDDEVSEMHAPSSFPKDGGYCSPPRDWRG